LLVTTVLALGVMPIPQTPASASCAAPHLRDADRLILERGATVVIEGRSFVDGCRDSMTCTEGLGCDSCEFDDPAPVPMEDVALRLAQRGRTWDLGIADAGTAEDNRLGWMTWTFDLPTDARPGPAKLLPEHAEPVRARVR
jgi:hypothetical protein